MRTRRIIPGILLTVLSGCNNIAEVTPAEVEAAKKFWKAYDLQNAFDAGIKICKESANTTPNPNKTLDVCTSALSRFKKLMQGERGLPQAYRESLIQCADSSYTTPIPNQNPAQQVCIWSLNTASDTFKRSKH